MTASSDEWLCKICDQVPFSHTQPRNAVVKYDALLVLQAVIYSGVLRVGFEKPS